METNTISAIILSAGESQRMGTPKALCQWKGITFLESVISYLRNAGIERIGIVLGAWELEIRAHGLPEGVEVWSNPNYKQGQLSSLQIGLKQQKSDILGTVVALVDHPVVLPETIRTLIRIFDNDPEKIVKPAYRKTGGHPILIGRNWWADIIFPPTSVGDLSAPRGNKRGVNTLRDILSQHPECIISVEVNDPGILIDIDTPEILSEHLPDIPPAIAGGNITGVNCNFPPGTRGGIKGGEK